MIDGRHEYRRERNDGISLLVVIAALVLTCVPSHGQENPRRVLILSGYAYTLPAATQLIDGIRARLLERGQQRLALDAEFLDLIRVSDPDHEARTATFIREKYAVKPPDVVIVVGRSALEFVAKYRDVVALKTPLVFAGIAPTTYAAIKPLLNITGVFFDTSLDGTLELAERLQPKARQLLIISDTSVEGRRWEETARRTMERRPPKFEITYLFGLSYDELMRRFAQIPSDSIVIFLSFFVDGAGKSFVPRQVASEAARISRAPVYTPYDSYIGGGVVGGFVEPFASHGAAAADLALAIDAGQDPAALPPIINPKSVRVDARAMARWGLKQDNLPPDSVVLFDKPRLWDEHRHLVLAVGAVVALQTLIVAALLIQRRRRRQAENSLAESEDRMTFTAATANIGLWQFDRSTDELWATDHCREMFGLPSGAPITRETFLAAVHPEDRSIAVGTLRGVIPGGSAVTDIRIVHPDGDIRWFRIRARASLDRKRTSDQLSGMLVDITDQKTAKAEAEAHRQEIMHLMRVSAVGELSGAIAHEVNQPLTAILSNAQAALYLLEAESPNLAEVKDALQDIVSEDKRAGDVVHRLRGLLKKGETRTELVDVNEIINSTTALLRSELINRRISVETDLSAAQPTVLGDPVQLQQVLLNLVINAMDAMVSVPESRRKVRISTQETDTGRVEICVKDNGTGIGEADRQQLFVPFHTTKAHGLGLGLTICSAIVRKHGGSINLDNEDTGGAVARISLPLPALMMAAQ